MAVLSRNEIIYAMLRRIGAFPVSMSSPRAGEVEEAAKWLDMIVAHQAARQRVWFLVDETVTFDVTADLARYDLIEALGTANTPRGFQFFIAAYLYDVDMAQDVQQLGAMTRDEYEALPNKAAPGVPNRIYVDRSNSPLAFLYPTPSDARTWRVRMVFQSYSTDFIHAQPHSKAAKMRQSWNLWTVTALAAECGSGPIRRLPADEVREMRDRATVLRNELEAEDNEQHAAQPRHVEYYNGI